MRVKRGMMIDAAGTGDLAVMTARCVGPNGYVLATDISASMGILTADAAREAGVTNVEARVMDADNLEIHRSLFQTRRYVGSSGCTLIKCFRWRMRQKRNDD